MKIYSSSDIDQKFKTIMNLMEEGKDLQTLKIYAGSLSLAVSSRIAQLKNGSAQSLKKDPEIAKLEEVAGRLNFKLNTSTIEEVTHDVAEAYKIYAMQ